MGEQTVYGLLKAVMNAFDVLISDPEWNDSPTVREAVSILLPYVSQTSKEEVKASIDVMSFVTKRFEEKK